MVIGRTEEGDEYLKKSPPHKERGAPESCVRICMALKCLLEYETHFHKDASDCMRKNFLFSLIAIYLGSSCQAHTHHNFDEKFFTSSADMPFDRIADLYINPEWIKLQLTASAYTALGGLQNPSADILIEDQKNFFIFNQMYNESCAVIGNNITITNNHSPIILYGNVSNTKASALLALGKLTITKNTAPCLFINNFAHYGKAADYGSAAFGVSFIIEDNPGLILFKNNNCGLIVGIGGAVGFGEKFLVRNSGPVIFEKNQADFGGAIATSVDYSVAEVFLFAEGGDIVFNQNTSRDLLRNSIYCQDRSELRFGARKNRAVRFYDPVCSKDPTDNPCVINPEPDHVGTVLFSGITVPKESLLHKDSCTSFFYDALRVNNGVLAIEDRAQMHVNTFSMPGGVLRLGSGAVLAGVKSSRNVHNSNIQVPNLAINLASVLKDDATPPKIWIYPKGDNAPYTEEDSADTSITLSGDLLFYDDYNQNPYESVNLSQPQKVALLYLCDTTSPKITNALNIGAINRGFHYGYQGSWEYFWERYTSTTNPATPETVNTNHSLLFANWTPTGFIPNPKHISYLTANTLWTTLYSLFPYMQNQPAEFFTFQVGGQYSRLLYKQDSEPTIRGFDMSTKGYWLQTTTSAVCNHQFTVQVGYTSAHTDEKQTEHSLASKQYAAALRFTSFWYHDWIETSAKLAYAYGNHHIHHTYPDDLADSFGDFFTNTWGGSFSVTTPFVLDNLCLLSFPFISVKGGYATLAAFREHGAYAPFLRTFRTEQPLVDISVPIGVMFQPLPTGEFIQGTLGISYQPSLFRRDPKIRTTLISSQGSWLTPSSTVGLQALVANLNIALVPTSLFRLYFEYEGRVSSSASCNYLAGGCSLCF